jgi:hypothetical protein
MLIAAALVVSRRPDAIVHAQFWGEDGTTYFANVYDHGLLRTLLVPMAGYLQEFPVLAAAVAQPFPLRAAPLVMNLLAIGVQVLPVGLLLGARARTISTDLRVRVLLAGLYVAIPGAGEIDANAVNAQWHLAVAAALVLMLAPPARRAGRLADGAILTLSGLTGPFCLILAPLALAQRRWRGRQVVANWILALLAACAAVQASCLLFFSHHVPSGFGAAPRASARLLATPLSFWQIVGGRVFAAPLVGDGRAITLAHGTVILLIGGIGLIGCAIAARTGPPELRVLLGLGGAVLAMSLARPLDSWPTLAHAPVTSRYFAIPEFAVLAALVWALGRSRPPAARVLAGIALTCTCAVGIPREWSYPPFAPTAFARQAAAFDRAPRGTRMVLSENPVPHQLVLVKR